MRHSPLVHASVVAAPIDPPLKSRKLRVRTSVGASQGNDLVKGDVPPADGIDLEDEKKNRKSSQRNISKQIDEIDVVRNPPHHVQPQLQLIQKSERRQSENSARLSSMTAAPKLSVVHETYIVYPQQQNLKQPQNLVPDNLGRQHSPQLSNNLTITKPPAASALIPQQPHSKPIGGNISPPQQGLILSNQTASTTGGSGTPGMDELSETTLSLISVDDSIPQRSHAQASQHYKPQHNVQKFATRVERSSIVQQSWLADFDTDSDASKKIITTR